MPPTVGTLADREKPATSWR
jgi:hypothetical protein